MKICPFCAEEIQDAAIKCKHCGERLDESPEKAATTPTPAPQQAKQPSPTADPLPRESIREVVADTSLKALYNPQVPPEAVKGISVGVWSAAGGALGFLIGLMIQMVMLDGKETSASVADQAMTMLYLSLPILLGVPLAVISGVAANREKVKVTKPIIACYQGECPHCADVITIGTRAHEKLRSQGKSVKCQRCSNFCGVTKDGKALEKVAIGVQVKEV